MVTGPAARAAFDIRKEDPRLRDRYGRHQWGQSALLARRLVEAGVRFVTLTFGGWDYPLQPREGRCSAVLPVARHRRRHAWSTTSTSAACSTRRS